MRQTKWGMMLALALVIAGTRPASAQWGWGVYGSGEFDTEDVVFALGGLRLTPATMWSWSPVLGLQAYWLQYPSGEDEKNSITAIIPSAGLTHGFSDGSVGFDVGYQFQSEDIEGTPLTSSATVGEGIVTMGHLDWGASRPVAVQILGSYNFGADAFWGRARSTLRIASMSPGALRLGAEVAHLNQSEDEDLIGDSSFSSTSVGPVLEWHTGRGVTFGAGAGRRFQEGDDATYFRLEMSLFPSM